MDQNETVITATAEAAESNDLRSMAEALTETAALTPVAIAGDDALPAQTQEAGLSRPFPLAALPSSIREYVERVAEIHRAPASLSACCALAPLSAAVGKGLRVRSLPGLLTPANLYTLVGASSGCGKSLAFKTITEPLREYATLGRALQQSDTEERIENIRVLELAIHEGRVQSEAADITAEERNQFLRGVAENES